MSKIEELQKRVEHLEIEVELLKELIKFQNKCPERIVPTYPLKPFNPYYSEPTCDPLYNITCRGEK